MPIFMSVIPCALYLLAVLFLLIIDMLSEKVITLQNKAVRW